MRGMTHAVVLVRAERSALPDLGGRLAELDGVAEAWSVTGEWDFVAILRVHQPEELARVMTERLAMLDGIERTYTMVAFEAYSEHDLEAMFSIGESGGR
jgi:DNA-binding Lrp family transcriptional regulator